MRGLGRRILGATGMGLAWAVAWGAAGGAAVLAGLDSDLPFGLLLAPFGFAAGVIFSGALAVVEARGRLDRVSPWGFAGWGAAAGLLVAVYVTALRGEASEGLVFGPALALAGAACGAGSLAVARRPVRATLPGGGPTEA